MDLDVWCADLAALLDAEGYARAVVGGHCLGANIAVEFARRCPERTAGLVLVEPMPREALVGYVKFLSETRPLFVPVAALLRALNALGLHRRRLRPLDLTQLDRATRAALAAGRTELLERYVSPRDDLATTPTVAWLQALMAVSRGLPDLAAVPAPALALLATGRAFTDPAIVERALARLPHCRTLKLDARHWIPTERPDEMRRAIEDWCAGLDRPSGAMVY